MVPVLILALTLTPIILASDHIFWAFTRTWPTPIPIHNESYLLPQFYSTSCKFGVPCKLKDRVLDNRESYNATKLPLSGTLCFITSTNNSTCILIRQSVLSTFEDPLRNLVPGMPVGTIFSVLKAVVTGSNQGSGNSNNNVTDVNVTTYWINVTAMVPKFIYGNDSYNMSRPMAPCYNSYTEYPPEFLDCRGVYDRVTQVQPGFWFTPRLDRYLFRKNSTKAGWPFSSWVLINSVGASCDLSPIINLNMSTVELYNVTGVLNATSRKLNTTRKELKHNATYPAGGLCLDPPFMFLLFNSSGPNRSLDSSYLDCTTTSCALSQCWRIGTDDSALVVRLPTFVPIPIKADPDKFPLATLLRHKRDFGFTAAIITAIAVSSAAAVTAGVAMANQVQTVTQINEVILKASSALNMQERVNTHLVSGVLLLNKRIDLLEGSIQDLFDIMTVGCVDRTPHICITPYPATLNDSKLLSSYLSGNWSREIEQLQANLTFKIQALNNTKVELITLGEFSDWMVKTFSYFKEWIGVGMFGLIVLAGMGLILFLLCRLRLVRRREKVAIARALSALEAGQSPQAWISILQDS